MQHPGGLFFRRVGQQRQKNIVGKLRSKSCFSALEATFAVCLGAFFCSFLRVMQGNAALELGNHSRLVFSEGITRKSKAVRKLFLLIKLPNALSSLFGDVSFRVGLDDFLQGCLSSINAAAGGL